MTDDTELRSLNARFLGIDEPTDVLAFPGGEALQSSGRVGDVAVSVERAIRQNPDGLAELRLLAVHGLLHCLGHDHADEPSARRMTEVTRQLLPGQTVPDLFGSVRGDSRSV